MANIQELTDESSKKQLVADHSAIIVYTKEGCPACHNYWPQVKYLAEKYPQLYWGHAETPKVKLSIHSFPTTSVYHDGQHVKTFVGDDPDQLQEWCTRLNNVMQVKSQTVAYATAPTSVTSWQQLAKVPTQVPAQISAAPSNYSVITTSTSGITDISSTAQLNSLIYGRNAVVVYTLDGCGPCHQYWPQVKQLAQKYNTLTWAHATAPSYKSPDVSAYPTTMIYKQGTLVRTIVGGKVDELNQWCAKLSQ